MTARILAVLSIAAALPAQDARRDFELLLPDFFETPFDGGLIDVPDRPLQRISVQVLNAAQRDISYGAVQVKVNGRGIGNAVDRIGNEKGILLVMNPFTAGMRPDQLFDPRENAIEVVAQDRRGRRYYQNWIVRVNDAQQNQLFTYTGAVSPDDARGVPPDIVVVEPKTPPVLGLADKAVKVAVECRVSGAGTVFSINGRAAGKPSVQSFTTVSETVVVTRETKELLLEAVDPKGHRRGVRIPVLVQEPPARRIRSAGGRYALLVGVSRYGTQPGAPPDLPAAASDATMLAAELETRAKFPKANIRLMTDDRARADQIRVALSEFAAQAQPDDLLLVFVAAHGLHDPGRVENLYLAPHGAQVSQLRSTAIEFTELEKLLNQNVRANNVLLVFDVGHKLEGEYRIAGRNLINRYLLNLFNEQAGRAVLVAGSADQVSAPAGGRAGGVLAHWLTESLRGKGDLNRDNVITAEEMFRFVAQQVSSESGGAQTPRFRLASRSGATAVAGQ